MVRLRFVAVGLLALVLTCGATQMGKSAGQVSTYYWTDRTSTPADGADQRTCVIYALDDMGYDGDLGKWIAQTIPEVVEPGCWKETGVLRYYAPKNILIVNQSEKVQKKVDGFLKNLKSSLPKTRDHHATGNAPKHLAVVPASHHVQVTQHAPDPLLVPSPVREPSAYPVPPPVKAPKHLFHFLIRYEGEGIIDDNVVKLMKVYGQAEQKAKNQKSDGVAAGGGAYSPATLPGGTLIDAAIGSSAQALSGEPLAKPKETTDAKPKKYAPPQSEADKP